MTLSCVVGCEAASRVSCSSSLSWERNPWPTRNKSETKETAFALQKRKGYWKRQGQGNSWDQYGDSSSAACPSASAEEGGNETHSVSEKANKWGLWPPESSSKHVQPAQPYKLQPANRGESGWADWAREVRRSQSEYRDCSSNGMRLPATPTPGTSLGNHTCEIGTGQSGLLPLQGIWVVQTTILIENGMHAQ